MTNDPVLEEVRRVRKLISDEIGPELAGLVEHYAQYDSRFKAKAIDAPDRRTKHCTEVAEQTIPDGSSSPATR
jgi:FMN phosphatase YigB (HAD superfamily)